MKTSLSYYEHEEGGIPKPAGASYDGGADNHHWAIIALSDESEMTYHCNSKQSLSDALERLSLAVAQAQVALADMDKKETECQAN